LPDSIVCLSFDFDAMSVWFGFERTTPAMLNRGEYGARVGVPRILDLLERREIRATFFVPGHTVESFPEETHAILERGHEIAHHSYAHVDPSQQSADEERADMERALAALERVGVRPLGYRSPSLDLSDVTLELVEEHGFVYDSSLMTDDFRPFCTTSRPSARSTPRPSALPSCSRSFPSWSCTCSRGAPSSAA
jgi:peptidoglycan-N-acetylglucosamine deacetylase